MTDAKHAGRDMVDRVLGEFIAIENAAPAWLVNPATGRHLAVDRLYPQLGLAVHFTPHQRSAETCETLAALCRQAGMTLVAVESDGAVSPQTLSELRTALNTAARRIAQQRTARKAKLSLLPRIASAQATCQQLLTAAPEQRLPVAEEAPAVYHYTRWQRWQLRRQANWRQFKGAWQVFSQNRLAVLGIVLIVMFGLMSISHPILMKTVWPFKIYNPDTGFDESVFHPSLPSSQHLLGTDAVGRDVLSLLLVSTTPAFVIGLTAALTSAIIGTAIGVVSAYFRGVVDAVFSRLADVFLLLPAPIVLVIVGARLHDIGPSAFGLIYGVIAGLGGAAVVMRSHALSIVTKPYIEAARVAGGGARQIMLSHIVPHMLPLAAVYMMVTVTGAVVADGFVSFLGITRVHHNWGSMIYMALAYERLISDTKPWNVLIPPSITFSLFAAAFYFISRGLHQVAEPRLRER